MRAVCLAAVLALLAAPAFACGVPPKNADIHKITKSHKGQKVYLSRCGTDRYMKINRSGKA